MHMRAGGRCMDAPRLGAGVGRTTTDDDVYAAWATAPQYLLEREPVERAATCIPERMRL
jgi:hypothetical protein